jgi:hypothetical protein
MTPDFYAAVPQMRDYIEETQVYAPYLMHFQRPNVRRGAVSTDALGFRRTNDARGEWLHLDRWSALPAAARPSAFIGNSTAFGVGATSDDRAIASQLNRLGPCAFFSFAGRTLNPLQELLAFLLFARVRVDTAVVMSGINLLDMSYRFAGDVRTSLPPFYLERLITERVASPGGGLRRWLHERWRRLRGRTTTDPFVDSDLVRALEAGLGPADALAAAAENPERALRHFEHVLDLWCALRPARVGRLVFALQPVPDWFGRPLGERERRLAAASEAHRPEAWRRIQGPLQERAPAFREALLRSLKARDALVVDLNVEGRLLALDWVFIDRYHLTDEAQRVVAEVLADAVRS